jgi:hypothetical protein
LRRPFFGGANLCRAHRRAGVKKDPDGVTFTMAPGKMKLTVCSDSLVREWDLSHYYPDART